tara:strand:- start:41811 stop:42716 length:906 start_codon:yes stop_codon:yes gene_type:complete
MDFDLNSYLKELDVIFEKAKKNISKKITKPQPAEDHFGFKKTKLRSLRYELGVMEINMKKMTEREFRKLKEEVDLEESKSSTGYELYHKDFSSAMQHAYDFAKKKYRVEIDPRDIDKKVATGPKRPSSGKANAYRLLDKTGKKAIQVQVTNLDNKRYELNMYKEDVEQVDEISKSMMGRYLKKSATSLSHTSYKHGAKSMSKNNYDDKKDYRKLSNRQSGIQRVASRLSKKEEVKVDEDSVKKARVNLRIKQTQARQQKVLDRLKRRKTRIKTEKMMRDGDKLSGKKEPINLEPELKTDKR